MKGFTIKLKAKKARGLLVRPPMIMRSKKWYNRKKKNKIDE
jgi:hypothetical protein